jgi:hypothetical protein
MIRLANHIWRGALGVGVLLGMLNSVARAGATPIAANSRTNAIDYEEPKLLIGTIFEMAPDPKKVLFTSQRTATRSGSTVRVVCEYTYPDGSLAARETMVYEAGKFASFDLEELQTFEKGRVAVRPDPKNPEKEKLFFEYSTGQGSDARKKSNTEALENETLVDDMIPQFIVTHWDALLKGSPAKFRYIALSRAETVGFKLVKESETTWHGKSVVRIKMEPTSLIIAQLVDPLFFVVEKDGAHRIVEYIGRTTPQIKKDNGKWKDLDAVTIFDSK